MTLFLWFLAIAAAIVVAGMLHVVVNKRLDEIHDEVFDHFTARIKSGDLPADFRGHNIPVDLPAIVLGATAWLCGIFAVVAWQTAFVDGRPVDDIALGLFLIAGTITAVITIYYWVLFGRLQGYAPAVRGIWLLASLYWLLVAATVFILLSVLAHANSATNQKK